MTDRITDEMVERACRVHHVGWSKWYEPQKKTAREVMRSALAAALPYMRVEVKDAALEEVRKFIIDQYRDHTEDWKGEWLAPEARPVFATVCAALFGTEGADSLSALSHRGGDHG